MADAVGIKTGNSNPHRLWWRGPWLVRRHWGLGQNLQTVQALASLSASRDCSQRGLVDGSPVLASLRLPEGYPSAVPTPTLSPIAEGQIIYLLLGAKMS